MANKVFLTTLQKELERIDAAGVAKRNENIIEGFTKEESPKGIIKAREYRIFNSNDYLGLRFNEELRQAEEKAGEQYGVGPGAVRFISGTLKVYIELEEAIAAFHSRQAGMVFSSAFAANIAVLASFLKAQSKDSLLSNEVVVISDALNHRSIIEGIRAASIDKEQKAVYKHLDYNNLAELLEQNKTNFKRAVVVTDGIFSMLGEYADLSAIRKVIDKYDSIYEEGIILVVDDSHGVGAFGQTGRGCEEVTGAKADILVGTFGKAFGSDGGYVVGDKLFIDYLRESAATYIYSNPVSPTVAASALQSVQMLDGGIGQKLLKKSRDNIAYFKQKMLQAGFSFFADSIHPIQPLKVADTLKTKKLKELLFTDEILVTNINYPVVAKGKDEIRIQISASHTMEDLDTFLASCIKAAKFLQLI